MNKSYLLSKTLWVSLITILVPISPEFEGFIKEHPQAIMTGVGIVFGFLRMITSKKLGK